MVTANAARRLIQHYVDNFRRLPWRSPPGEPPAEPYRVWLSEVMLQQTTVATVTPRFERFIARWPSLAALAAADEAEILAEWAGLGYYSRARNLIRCARELVARGGFPKTAAELRELPGIGNYTSGAIAAIAFGEKAAAIDTNIKRVLGRLQGLRSPRPAAIERELLAMMETERPGDVVQALMDLGATICRPKDARCSICPLRLGCAAEKSGEPEAYPGALARKARPHRYGTAWWIERDEQVWLVRRPATGLLGGMAALPGDDWTDTPARGGEALATVRHVFSHFSLDLCVEPRANPPVEGWWQPIASLEKVGLPTLYLKAARETLRRRSSIAA